MDEWKRVCNTTRRISLASEKVLRIRCDERQATLCKWELWKFERRVDLSIYTQPRSLVGNRPWTDGFLPNPVNVQSLPWEIPNSQVSKVTNSISIFEPQFTLTPLTKEVLIPTDSAASKAIEKLRFLSAGFRVS